MADQNPPGAPEGQLLGQLFGTLRQSLIGMQSALGVRLGLYAGLAEHGPCSAAELAAALGLDARFLQEWLCAQAANDMISFEGGADADPGHFFLSDAQRTVYTDEASPFYGIGALRTCGAMGRMLELLPEAFATGTGYAYDALGAEFTQGIEEMLRGSCTAIARRALARLPGAELAADGTGARVADLGCGSGRLAVEAALALPQASVHGFDISAVAIARARALAEASGVAGRVTIHDASVPEEAIGAGEPFDVIVANDVIHDLDEPERLLREARAALKPTGAFLVVDTCTGGDSVADKLAHPGGKLSFACSVGICLPSATTSADGVALGTMGLSPAAMDGLARAAGFSAVETIDSQELMGAEGHACYILRP